MLGGPCTAPPQRGRGNATRTVVRIGYVDPPAHDDDIGRYRARGYAMKGTQIAHITDRPTEFVEVHPRSRNSVEMTGVTVGYFRRRRRWGARRGLDLLHPAGRVRRSSGRRARDSPATPVRDVVREYVTSWPVDEKLDRSQRADPRERRVGEVTPSSRTEPRFPRRSSRADQSIPVSTGTPFEPLLKLRTSTITLTSSTHAGKIRTTQMDNPMLSSRTSAST
jgi:hypothetical protein